MLEVKIMAVAQFPPTLSRHLAASSFIGRSELRQTLPRVRIAAPVVCINIRTPLWSPRYIYSSDIADVDPRQVSELWAKTLEVRRDPVKVMESLKHSYAFVVVLTRKKEAEGNQTNIVGIGRAISDGAFIATICDVAVDPAHQRRGIGRKIVKNLAKVMKKMDGPSGFAVFPPPLARRFFWMIGFRSDKNFYFMVYRGKLLNGTVSMDLSSMVSEEKDSSHGLEMRDLNLGLAYTSTPKNQLSSDLEFFKGINENLQ